MKKASSQEGIAVVETILIVLIVALIAGVGYYVWRASQQANKTLDAASKVAQSSPQKVTKKVSQKYLIIKEWGVKIPLSANISDAYYLYQPPSHGSGYVGLSLGSLKDTGCSADRLPPVLYYRVKDGAEVQTPAGTVASPTDSTSRLSGFDYYWSRGTTGVCSLNTTQEQQAESAQADFVTALAHIQAE